MKNNKIIFENCRKGFTRDQDKAVTPEETIEKFFRQIESFDVKILSEVKRIDNGRLDIPVYFSVCTDEARALTGTKKQMGKGASPEQSKASACMELAERFSFFAFKSDEDNFIRGDYRSLREQGYPVMDSGLLLKSVNDYKMTPAEIEELLSDIPIQWTWVTNLTKDEQVLMPFSWFYAINEFNGSSAGNTIEEAALQGISEIVERDVCCRVDEEKMMTPAIDKNSISDPVAVELMEKFKCNNIELYLNDFSLDTGITTVGALAIDRSTFPELSEIVYTAGTTPGPEKAIIRAVTEVAQLAGDFNSGSNYIASGLPKPVGMNEVEYITETGTSVTVREMADLSDENIKVELERFLSALEKKDRQVFMIDATHPELQIPALYTVIPGARFRERSKKNDAGLFAAKLLYENCADQDFFAYKLACMEEIIGNSYYLHFYKGISYFNRAEYQAAVEQLKMALENDPEKEDIPYIYSYLGHCLKDTGEYHGAIEALKRGLEEDDQRPDIHNLLGVCYFKQEEYLSAISHFEKAVELNPSSAMDYANLGVNHNKLGNKEEAINYFTLALTLDPSLDFAQEQLNSLVAQVQIDDKQ